jgi:hypothetical protein
LPAVPLEKNSSPIRGKMKILIGIEDSIFSYNAARFVALRTSSSRSIPMTLSRLLRD